MEKEGTESTGGGGYLTRFEISHSIRAGLVGAATSVATKALAHMLRTTIRETRITRDLASSLIKTDNVWCKANPNGKSSFSFEQDELEEYAETIARAKVAKLTAWFKGWL